MSIYKNNNDNMKKMDNFNDDLNLLLEHQLNELNIDSDNDDDNNDIRYDRHKYDNNNDEVNEFELNNLQMLSTSIITHSFPLYDEDIHINDVDSNNDPFNNHISYPSAYFNHHHHHHHFSSSVDSRMHHDMTSNEDDSIVVIVQELMELMISSVERCGPIYKSNYKDNNEYHHQQQQQPNVVDGNIRSIVTPIDNNNNNSSSSSIVLMTLDNMSNKIKEEVLFDDDINQPLYKSTYTIITDDSQVIITNNNDDLHYDWQDFLSIDDYSVYNDKNYYSTYNNNDYGSNNYVQHQLTDQQQHQVCNSSISYDDDNNKQTELQPSILAPTDSSTIYNATRSSSSSSSSSSLSYIDDEINKIINQQKEQDNNYQQIQLEQNEIIVWEKTKNLKANIEKELQSIENKKLAREMAKQQIKIEINIIKIQSMIRKYLALKIFKILVINKMKKEKEKCDEEEVKLLLEYEKQKEKMIIEIEFRNMEIEDNQSSYNNIILQQQQKQHYESILMTNEDQYSYNYRNLMRKSDDLKQQYKLLNRIQDIEYDDIMICNSDDDLDDNNDDDLDDCVGKVVSVATTKSYCNIDNNNVNLNKRSDINNNNYHELYNKDSNNITTANATTTNSITSNNVQKKGVSNSNQIENWNQAIDQIFNDDNNMNKNESRRCRDYLDSVKKGELLLSSMFDDNNNIPNYNQSNEYYDNDYNDEYSHILIKAGRYWGNACLPQLTRDKNNDYNDNYSNVHKDDHGDDDNDEDDDNNGHNEYLSTVVSDLQQSNPLLVKEINLNVEKIKKLNFLKKFKNLEKLNLNVNYITDFNNIFYNCRHIITLSAKDNHIKSITDLHYLKNHLKYLYLDSNKINDISILSDFHELIILTLNSNFISYLPQLKCKKLQRLELYCNHLTSITLETASPSPLISSSKSSLTTFKSSSLSELYSLTYLDLGYNQITSLTNHEFSSCLLLQTLILSKNQLQQVPSPLYLPVLKTLWLNNNKIKNLNLWKYYYNNGRVDGHDNESYDNNAHDNFNNNNVDKNTLHKSYNNNNKQSNNDNEKIIYPLFLPSLNKLFLHDNLISTIPRNIMNYFPLLIELDLSFNLLSSRYSISCIEQCVYLMILNIQDNLFTTVSINNNNENNNIDNNDRTTTTNTTSSTTTTTTTTFSSTERRTALPIVEQKKLHAWLLSKCPSLEVISNNNVIDEQRQQHNCNDNNDQVNNYNMLLHYTINKEWLSINDICKNKHKNINRKLNLGVCKFIHMLRNMQYEQMCYSNREKIMKKNSLKKNNKVDL
jgi:hypothetical protein